MGQTDSHDERVAQAGREVIYAHLGISAEPRMRFERRRSSARDAIAEDPAGATEQLIGDAGKAIAAVLVYEHTLGAANAGRRFGQAAGRGVWDALT